MNGYTKLFSSIVSSTIWREDLATKVVWITMLAMSDSDGNVEGSVPGLAHLAGVSLEECERSLSKLQEPDKFSRTSDNEGRRIEVIDGGWFIVNRAKYRDLIPEESRRERDRLRQQRYRAKTDGLSRVTECDSHALSLAVTPEREREREIVKERSKSKSLSLRSKQGIRLPEDFVPSEEHYALGKELGINTEMEFQKFRDHFLGVSGSKGFKRDWPATLRNWLRNSVNYQRGSYVNQKSAAQLRNERNKALAERIFREDDAAPDVCPSGGEGTS